MKEIGPKSRVVSKHIQISKLLNRKTLLLPEDVLQVTLHDIGSQIVTVKSARKSTIKLPRLV